MRTPETGTPCRTSQQEGQAIVVATVGRSRWAVARAGARGLVGAMAMTGLHTVTAAISPREESPPEAIIDERAPELVRRLPERSHHAVIEAAYWTNGAAGGVVFGLLPARIRSHPAAGPAYGLSIWLSYELGIVPALGIRPARQRGVLWRVMVAMDHVLYGVVVAGRLAPEPSVRP
jgi:hypothetical protein